MLGTAARAGGLKRYNGGLGGGLLAVPRGVAFYEGNLPHGECNYFFVGQAATLSAQRSAGSLSHARHPGAGVPAVPIREETPPLPVVAALTAVRAVPGPTLPT